MQQTTLINHTRNRTHCDMYLTLQMISQTVIKEEKTVPSRHHRIEALKPLTTGMIRKIIWRLLKLSSSYQRLSPSIRDEVDVRRKDGLEKKRRQLRLENGKRYGHKTANQCMMPSHQVLLPSIWCCATESDHVW